MSAPQASSWAEELKLYKAQKNTPPPRIHDEFHFPNRAFREPRFAHLRGRFDYDLIAHQHKDPTRERTVREQEDREKIRRSNRGKDKSLRAESAYDIVSHRSKVPAGTASASSSSSASSQSRGGDGSGSKASRGRASQVGYNIISNQELGGSGGSSGASGTSSRSGSSLASRVETREFDIISNRYFEQEEERTRQDELQAQDAVRQKLRTLRSFDPVQVRYYDDDREQEFLERSEKEKRLQEMKRAVRVPEALRGSEGYMYNITSMEVRDDNALRRRDERARARKAWRKQKYVVEEKIRAESMDKEERHLQSGINRIKTRAAQSHGYDILSGAPHRGRRGRAPPAPRGPREPSVWETIQSLAGKNRDGGDAGAGAGAKGDQRGRGRSSSASMATGTSAGGRTNSTRYVMPPPPPWQN